MLEPDESSDQRDQPGSDGSGKVQPAGELYVEAAVSDLPDAPKQGSFAITGDGIVTFGGSKGSWQPIQYGSRELPVPSISARAARVGDSPSGRPLISNGKRTVYVDPKAGDDTAKGTKESPLATIQEAVRRAPIYLRDQFVIDLATVPDTPVTYDEDVLVPTVIATGQAGQEAEAPKAGPFINLNLRGNVDDSEAVRIGSLMFGNLVGTAAGNLYGATILRDSPYDDEGFGLSAYGSGEVKLVNVQFTDGPTNGILTYGARMKARQVRFGDGNLEIGFKAKRHASALLHNPAGSLRKDAFRATANSTISILNGRDVSGEPLFNTLRGGLIYDEVSGSWVGLSGNADVSDPANLSERSTQSLYAPSNRPADASPGDIWYDDGSGEATEGFYGQTSDGPKRLH